MQDGIQLRNNLVDLGVIKSFYKYDDSQSIADINMDILKLDENTMLHQRVVTELARLAFKFNPDIIVPIPSDANMLGAMVSNKIGKKSVRLAWADKVNKIPYLTNPDDFHIVKKSQKVLFIDEVFNEDSPIHTVSKHRLFKGELGQVKDFYGLAIIGNGQVDYAPDDRLRIDVLFKESMNLPETDSLN